MTDSILKKDDGKESVDIGSAIADLQQDIAKTLTPRIRALTHDITCSCSGVTLRVHYPSFRSAECTIKEFVDVITLYLMRFTLPRKKIRDLWQQKDILSAEEYDLLQSALRDDAFSLFKKAQINTNRNGEAGELLLYLLTEWILDAPQILAKMSLKTNPEMPVHGSDGVHVRFNPESKKLEFFWGESKLYSNVVAAIQAAATSIATSLQPNKVSHELFLIERDIDLSGLDDAARAAFLKYLNPMTEESNDWISRITCLIGFDFKAYGSVKTATGSTPPEELFRAELTAALPEIASKLAEALMKHDLANEALEIFFFPLPSVATFRNLFQDKIGWKPTESKENHP